MLKKKKECTICKLKQYLLLDIFFLHIFGLQYHRPIYLQPHLFPDRFSAGIGSSILTALQCWLKIYFGVFLNWISDQDLKLKFTLFERQVIYRKASSCSECERVGWTLFYVHPERCLCSTSFWTFQFLDWVPDLGLPNNAGSQFQKLVHFRSWGKLILRQVCWILK